MNTAEQTPRGLARRPLKRKSYLRAWVAITMLTAWPVVTISGILLWIAPDGRQSGQRKLFLGLNKAEWGDIHLWISLAALAITAVHLVVDWKALKGAMRYLATVHRDRWPVSQSNEQISS